MKKLLLISGLCATMLVACSKEQNVLGADPKPIEANIQTSLNEFRSARDLELAINQSEQELRSARLYAINEENEALEDLVPNDNFRRLLSTEGRFVVADTLYQISPKGTFFAHIKDSVSLKGAIELADWSNAKQVRDSLYQLGNVFLYQTYGVEGYQEAEDNEAEAHPEELRSLQGNQPDIDTFPIKRMNRITLAGKAIEKLFGTKKDGIEVLRSNRRRRLSGSLYSYNYLVYAERGLMTQVEKKMWHGGWGRVVNWSGTTIGFHGIIFQEDLEEVPTEVAPFYQDRINNVSVFANEGAGLSLEILNQNFMLNPEDKFAFYAMRSDSKLDSDGIEAIAHKLKAGYGVYSFQKLRDIHQTQCVGFVIDVPKEKTRYTYIMGTSRWASGPRQVKVFERRGPEVNWGELAIGVARLSYGLTKVTIPGGGFIVAAKAIIGTPDVKKGLMQIAKSFKPAKPRTHVAGSAFAYTSDGDGYCGMIMYKQQFGK